MEVRNREEIFQNQGRLSPILRTILFFVAWLVATTLLGMPVLVIVSGFNPAAAADAAVNPRSLAFIAVAWVSLAAAFLVTYYFTTRVDKQSIHAVGLWPHPGWRRELLAGLGLGFVLVVVMYLVLRIAGLTVPAPPTTNAAYALFLGIVVFVPMAVTEEIVFRGYVLRNLAQALGNARALVFSGIIFALGHTANPDYSILALVNIGLAGILMGYPYLRSGSLWLATGLHFAWNFSMGTLFGMPVSGLSIPGLTDTLLRQPLWLSGGPFGPEGGIIASLACVAGLLILARRYRRPEPVA